MIENNEGKKEIRLDGYEKQLFANLKMKSIIIIIKICQFQQR